MPSAQEQAAVVKEYLGKECAEGRMVGQLDLNEWPGIHVNPFGVIPKSTPGKWRLITSPPPCMAASTMGLAKN